MSVYVDGQPWPEITKSISAARGRVVAAVAYIGVSGDTLLPLKDRDVLVCDADALTVRQGSTYAAPLLRLVHRGVEVHSVIGLHAKVVVCPRAAFVGSANASATSADQKIEAVAKITEVDDVRALRGFVMSLTSEETLLTEGQLEALAQVQPKPRAHTSKRPPAPAELPVTVDQIRIVRTAYVQYSPRVEKAAKATRRSAGAAARRRGAKVKLESLYWESWPTVARWRDGEWLLEETDASVAPPAWIVSRNRVGNSGLVWLARPRATRSMVPWHAVAERLRAYGLAPDLRDRRVSGKQAATALLDLFR